MRPEFCGVRRLGVTVALLAASAAVVAQGPGQSEATYDGGTRETLESIFIPPKPRAPFMLTLETEWTRPFGNGGTYTVVNKRRIMRDSAGRIYEERWLLVPKNGKLVSRMNYIQIADPAAHTLYNCEVEKKRCFLVKYEGSTTTNYEPGMSPSGPLQNGTGYHVHEELGKNSIDGLEVLGYRETTTVNAGVMGNDQPMSNMREFWYSPELGISLLSKVDSANVGKQTFTVTELVTSEPGAEFFAIPEGFTVEERGTRKVPGLH
jgi:hypothetical protein